MRWLANLSISGKLMLIIMTTSVLVLLIASTAFIFNDRISTQKKLVYLVTSQADLVGANSTAALAFHDTEAAIETLRSLSAQDHILAAVLYDKDGQELATYHEDPRAKLTPHQSVTADVEFDGDVLQVTQPIFLDNAQIGTIVLLADVNRLYAQLGDVTWIVLIVLLGALMAGLLVSTRIHRAISVPIKNLALITRQISREQDYSARAKKSSDDELGELVDGINEMLEQIQTRDQMLEQHAETLEKKVNERTEELHELTEKFRHRAYHDELTGLPNRALFEDRLSHALENARRSQNRLAVLFLDLDRFKIVNDTLGHATGDKLLAHLGKSIAGCLRKADTVARLGGDEFTVMLQDVDNVEIVGRMARKIIDCVQEPVEIDGHELHISTSIGISMFPDDAQDTVGLMRCADAAMYLSKDGGRNRHHFYTESMHQIAMKRMRLENELHQAIKDNALTLVYLPKQDLINKQVEGVEALLRWDHPEYGQILHDEFMQVAEDSGLILSLGEWVLDSALKQLQQWDQAGIPIPRLAINISGHQLVRTGMANNIYKLLNKYALKAERIELEFSEKSLDAPTQNALINLQELSDLGIKLAIDDFGSELGSLNQLRKLPVDIVKICKDIIHHISEEDERTAIINAIVLMAHGMGISVVAKGVESQSELDCLIKAGCDQVQGFFLNRPVTADRIPAILNKSKS